MAYTAYGVSTGGNVVSFTGLSSEVKPTTSGLGAGSTFYELDTGNVWFYEPGHTNAITSNGWWQM